MFRNLSHALVFLSLMFAALNGGATFSKKLQLPSFSQYKKFSAEDREHFQKLVINFHLAKFQGALKKENKVSFLEAILLPKAGASECLFGAKECKGYYPRFDGPAYCVALPQYANKPDIVRACNRQWKTELKRRVTRILNYLKSYDANAEDIVNNCSMELTDESEALITSCKQFLESAYNLANTMDEGAKGTEINCETDINNPSCATATQ